MSKEIKKLPAIREPYTKAQLFSAIAEDTGLGKKDVAAVFESLGDTMHRHLKSRSAGAFTLPGLAKFTVNKKAATKARPGVNPFTGEEIMISAKPARRVVKIRALKGVKDMAES
jgi:nucleoid DNA-binding protein